MEVIKNLKKKTFGTLKAAVASFAPVGIRTRFLPLKKKCRRLTMPIEAVWSNVFVTTHSSASVTVNKM